MKLSYLERTRAKFMTILDWSGKTNQVPCFQHFICDNGDPLSNFPSKILLASFSSEKKVRYSQELRSIGHQSLI